MDLATQEVGDTQEVGAQEKTQTSSDDIWGKLFPLNCHYPAIDMRTSCITFGRGESCDVIFESEHVRNSNVYSSYSKEHFRITRNVSHSGNFTFLEDRSSNGTFVNGTKIGKGKRQLLQNNDSIEMSFKKNKVYVYLDLKAKQEKYPPAVTDKYSVANVLGRGACGEVKLVFEKVQLRQLAMKVIEKKTFSITNLSNLNSPDTVQSEVNILRALKHPNIIRIEDVIDTDTTLYIVLELVVGGELFDRVVKVGQFPESTAKLLCYQMLQAVRYLHDNGITHRDLKPENILLCDAECDDSLIKVTDFGMSKFVDANTMLRTFCGTPNYLAPEILMTAGQGSYTSKIDVWSLGVIFFICLVGYPPFTEERSDCSLTEQIKGGKIDFPKEHWKNVSTVAIDLLKHMIVVDPHKRFTVEQAIKHKWFQDQNMLKQWQNLLKKNDDSTMAPPSVAPPVVRKRRAPPTVEESLAENGDSSSSSSSGKSKRMELDMD